MMPSPSAQLAFGDPTYVKKIEELHIRVLAPIFYSRFIQYAYSLDGILSEYSDNSTIEISNSDLMSTLDFDFDTTEKSPLGIDTLTRIKFSVLQHVRFRLSLIENTETQKVKAKLLSKSNGLPTVNDHPKHNTATKQSISAFLFDTFVLSEASQTSSADVYSYASKSLELFLVDYIAFGWVEIFHLEVFLVKTLAIWGLARSL
ncbi:hypothetical protein BOTCAL_0870g00020 [Botryotinia calthae]|uniref:Uncharacterized protein n=1 Tax=Botryotinia calthae TaxID=38488 RepID=A0A4Y8CHD4_9HELO|nr:hypothetical protein BOTCAL_0870g00020 [Botryotinia calthae]